MRVHLIRKKTIEQFVREHPQSRVSLTDWLTKIRMANWEKPADILETFRNADLLGSGSSRVVFNIAGNQFRLICKYVFGETFVHLYVCWIGKHSVYNELCSNKEQYVVHIY
jgi:mRNA interferase HigB